MSIFSWIRLTFSVMSVTCFTMVCTSVLIEAKVALDSCTTKTPSSSFSLFSTEEDTTLSMFSRTSLIRTAMEFVAILDWSANLLTSLATTARPLPASPARAASIEALSAKILVSSAIRRMVRTISSIFTEPALNFSILLLFLSEVSCRSKIFSSIRAEASVPSLVELMTLSMEALIVFTLSFSSKIRSTINWTLSFAESTDASCSAAISLTSWTFR